MLGQKNGFGKCSEPRPGLRSGSIDTSINVPYETLLNEDMTFKKKPELLALFRKANLELKIQLLPPVALE